MEEKKDYYFSYARYHRQLNVIRCLSQIPFIDGATEFDLLCNDIRLGIIGDYSEVEWKLFALGLDSFCKLKGHPFFSTPYHPLKMEILRAMVYWRDHVREILPKDSEGKVILQFEIECCQQIKDFISICEEEVEIQISEGHSEAIEKPFTISVFGDKAVLENRHKAENFMASYIESEDWKTKFTHCSQINIDDIEHGSFPIAMILYVANFLYMKIINNEDNNDSSLRLSWHQSDMQSIISEICRTFEVISGRYIRKDNNAILWVLWIICLHFAYDHNSNNNKTISCNDILDYIEAQGTAEFYNCHQNYTDIVKSIKVESQKNEESSGDNNNDKWGKGIIAVQNLCKYQTDWGVIFRLLYEYGHFKTKNDTSVGANYINSFFDKPVTSARELGRSKAVHDMEGKYSDGSWKINDNKRQSAGLVRRYNDIARAFLSAM